MCLGMSRAYCSVYHVGELLAAIRPTIFACVPRVLEKVHGAIHQRVEVAPAVRRALFRWAVAVGREVAEREIAGAPVAGALALRHRIADRLVLARVRGAFGGRLRGVISGGAALPTETMALWHMYGVNVVEMYGQTEGAGGIVAGQRGPFPRPGTVGTAPEGWDVRLGGDGEVLVRSADLFEGYWNDPAATAALMAEDGYWHTGDVGEWRDGNLRLVDRARDFIVTAGGKTIAPSAIENLLRASPYIAEAVVIGHGRKYLTALIEIDPDTVSNWARGNDVTYTGFTNLAAHPQVVALIAAAIGKANADLARVEQVKAFRILPKALDPEEENEPVTPTRKVKRALMAQRFKPLVDAMYDDSESRLLAGEVRDALSA